MVSIKVIPIARTSIRNDLRAYYLVWMLIGLVPMVMFVMSQNNSLPLMIIGAITTSVVWPLIAQYLAFSQYFCLMGSLIWDNKSQGKIVTTKNKWFYILSMLGLLTLGVAFSHFSPPAYAQWIGLIGALMSIGSVFCTKTTLPAE